MKRIRRNNMLLLGWAMIALGVAAYVLLHKLGQGQQGFFTVGATGSGIFGGCLAAGIGMIRAGGSEQSYRKYKAEHNDERAASITRRAAVVTLFATWFLCLAVVIWQSVTGNAAIAQAFDALLVMSVVIFAVVEAVIERRM